MRWSGQVSGEMLEHHCSWMDRLEQAQPPSSCSPYAGVMLEHPMMCVLACQSFAVMLEVPMSSPLCGRSPPRTVALTAPNLPSALSKPALPGGRDCHLMEDTAPSRHMQKRPFILLCSHSLFVPFSWHPARFRTTCL